MFSWYCKDGEWVIDLGFEPVPTGARIDILKKDGSVQNVKLVRVFKEDEYWYGSLDYGEV